MRVKYYTIKRATKASRQVLDENKILCRSLTEARTSPPSFLTPKKSPSSEILYLLLCYYVIIIIHCIIIILLLF